MCGGSIGGSCQDQFHDTAKNVYELFLNSGHADEAIIYMNVVDTHEIMGSNRVDGISSESNLQIVIDWLCDYSDPSDEIIIYLFDHGAEPTYGSTYCKLNNDNYLYDYELEAMLSTPELDYEKLICVLDSCYSGAFIPELSGSDRIIITSTDAENPSYGWPSMTNPPEWRKFGSWFSVVFIESLDMGNSFRDAFQDAVIEVDNNIQYNLEEYGQESDQNSLLDDNGDGIGNQYIPINGDGIDEGFADQTTIF